jgi:hypothetical protein
LGYGELYHLKANSNSESELIAEKEFNGDFSILNWSKFENLKYYYNE